MTVSVLWLFLKVPLVGLQFLIVVFPGHTHLPFGISQESPDKVRKRAKIRNRYNQVPHLTQDTNGKVTNSQLDVTNESQEASLLTSLISQRMKKIQKEMPC